MISPNSSKAISEGLHMKALMSVPEFIESGIPAEIHKDTHGRGFDVMRLYSAIEIGGEIYRVKSTVRRVAQGDRYYTYELQEMELIEDPQIYEVGMNGNPVLNSTNSITGAKLLKGIKKTNSEEFILSSPESMERAAASMAQSLGVKARIITDVNQITSANKDKQRRMRMSKGWFDTKTGEVVVVLPNNESVAEAQATVLHEIVGHKSMRNLVGEKNYNDFLQKVYVTAAPQQRKRRSITISSL